MEKWRNPGRQERVREGKAREYVVLGGNEACPGSIVMLLKDQGKHHWTEPCEC